MLIYSPRWLFLIPGLVLAVAGTLFATLLALGPLPLGNVRFDTGSLAVACMAVIIGGQLMAFAFFTKVFAIAEGLLPPDARFARMFKFFSLEKGICLGLGVLLLGVGLFLRAVWVWKQARYGPLPYADNMRRLIPTVTLIVAGIQIIFSSFFMSVLGLKTSSRRPPAL
jgi:hypothetical protein